MKMTAIQPESWKEDYRQFEQATEQFYSGEMDAKTYKGISGGFGSYAQKGGKASMLRLRMPGGVMTKEKLAFVVQSIKEYEVKRVHLTTCQTLQLHDLSKDQVCELAVKALSCGIVTRGGGGDFPRNVMVSPLAGVEEGEYFDVLPYALKAADYLMSFIKGKKLPRKLKVGFSNTPKNVTHATYRDLGFAAREDGTFDVPRNVMVSPLAGVEEGEYFDVLPYALKAADYLMSFIKGKKLPRKLKVGFSNTPKNVTHATYRDLGFAAREDGTFDVYSAGGLGNKPAFGVRVAEGVAPDQILYYIRAMHELFCAYGNYENRAKARSRFMQEALGGAEAYKEAFLKKLDEVYAEEGDLTLEMGETSLSEETVQDQSTAFAASREILFASISDPYMRKRVIPQKQNGLYSVACHPLGGSPEPSLFADLYEVIESIPGAELRLSPEEMFYVINCRAEDVKKVLEVTSSEKAVCSCSRFEESVACIGASICQQGVRDSQALLHRLIEMEREEGFEDGILPQIHISGCPSSCGTHQTGVIGFRGGVKSVNKEVKPAFNLFVKGCCFQGKERMGEELGAILEENIPAFLKALGHAVQESGLDFEGWYAKDAEGIRKIAENFLA